jgi:phosphate acetyltransferase
VLGQKDALRSVLKKHNLTAEQAGLCDPKSDSRGGEFAQAFYEQRKHKGVALEQARNIVQDEVYFGTMLVKLGYADGLVAGAAHSTADTIRPALQIIKPQNGIKTISSMFFMCFPDKTLLFADCGLVENPTDHQLVDIAVSTARTGLAFGFSPRIAMLSYSTKGSATGDVAAKMARASERAKQEIQAVFGDKVLIDGEMQFDAAFVPEIAARKAPGSCLGGMANTFIFPDLGAGNICYKAVQRLSGCQAFGPVLQGLNHPVNDLSRGCSAEDIVATVAITAIQAQGK